MKELSERGQGVKSPKKEKYRRLTTLIVQAGIAGSVREATEMLAAGEICVGGRDHGWPVNVLGERIFSDAAQYGRTMFCEDTQVVHRSKCPKCRNKPIVFAKRERKPAISSATHSRVLDDYIDPQQPIEISSLDPEPKIIPQDILDRWLVRWKYFTELDDWIARALSLGATVEEGGYTAKLEMRRDEDGRTYMKVFVR
jgi:hypothetical protein